MTEPTLLPCPFCGNAPEVTEPTAGYHEMWAYVHCKAYCNVRPRATGTSTVTGWDGHKTVEVRTKAEAAEQARERAIAAWNTRATNVETVRQSNQGTTP